MAPWYRAPEVLNKAPEYDHRVDLWGTGCILVELLQSQECYKLKGIKPKERIMFSGHSKYFPIEKSEAKPSQYERI